MTVLERIQIRVPEANNTPDLFNELIQTAVDRINLRVKQLEFPKALESILVEIVIKMYRRIYYEGISVEWADTIKTEFVDDIFMEYDGEFENWIAMNDGEEGNDKLKVRFI